jgi:hypothetical protein
VDMRRSRGCSTRTSCGRTVSRHACRPDQEEVVR